MSEPFACLGEHTRSSPTSVYPAQAAKSFFVAMESYLKPHLNGTIYTTMEQPKTQIRHCGDNSIVSGAVALRAFRRCGKAAAIDAHCTILVASELPLY
ncbi:hypothetical protein Y032_0050g1946 [Ancylostoma ceylanicum]|uniref:Uncharacterized protein n=1 Tax=Ancylostoma ceylanicum TaxID=53326 RepID=A0A016U8M2_9BILA|nr:hypothetical protein Y032_0050g1946 [Ancylostoma ceylanicum]